MAMQSPRRSAVAAGVLSNRLKQCWSTEFNWDLLPGNLREGCHQIGRAISMPPVAVLAGLLLTVSFSMSHSVVQVDGTEWVEPVLLWIAVCMPTGSGKSALCKFLKSLVDKSRSICGLTSCDPFWFLDDQSFEKMGSIMSENYGKLIGLYDELAMFLSQINVFRGRSAISDTHELAVFLQLYSANAWTRRTVSGDANFSMQCTGLTLGGFIQPSVAKSLIEQQSNVEKGLCQRFLWVCPKATFVKFNQLQRIEENFVDTVACLMSKLWTPDKTIHKWILPKRGHSDVQEVVCGHFEEKYNSIQELIMRIGSKDELLSGMLSKSKGQILRVAAVMHVIFHMDSPTSIPSDISEEAVKAADAFVNYCVQHAAFLGGRGDISSAIDEFEKTQPTTLPDGLCEQDFKVASYCLLLPGKMLHLSALLAAKRFRDRGNKDGAVKAMKILQDNGLGTLNEIKPQRGASLVTEIIQYKIGYQQIYQFKKADVPLVEEETMEFVAKLMKFGVSLSQYKEACSQDEITMATVESRKRRATSPVGRPHQNKEE